MIGASSGSKDAHISLSMQAGLAGVLGLAGSENVQVRPACMQAASQQLPFASSLCLWRKACEQPWFLATTMSQGEDQKKLDVLANEVFINVLRRCGQCAVLVRACPQHPSVQQSCRRSCCLDWRLQPTLACCAAACLHASTSTPGNTVWRSTHACGHAHSCPTRCTGNSDATVARRPLWPAQLEMITGSRC